MTGQWSDEEKNCIHKDHKGGTFSAQSVLINTVHSSLCQVYKKVARIIESFPNTASSYSSTRPGFSICEVTTEEC